MDNARFHSPSRSQSVSRSTSPSPSPHAVSVASPPAYRPNGRTAVEPVTIAAASQHALTLALPIQHPRPGGGAAAAGRDDCWSEGATSALIDAWGERYLELSRGNLKQKQWQEVADAVSSRDDYTKPPKSDVQCKNRIDTLKKKYKLEKSRLASPGSSPSWPFFHRLDLLIGPNHKPTPNPLPPPPPTKPPPFSFPQRQRTSHQKKRSPPPSPPLSPDSYEESPPKMINGGKHMRPEATGRMKGLHDLTHAIMRFAEVYQRAESSKLKQTVEMEKQRMEFTRELQLQRMEFFMKTQVELAQLKRHGRRDNKRKPAPQGTSNNNNNNIIINNNSGNSS